MSRLQDRTWYVLPAPRKMVWRFDGNSIPVTVLAFCFQDDFPYWLTANSVVIAGVELRDGNDG